MSAVTNDHPGQQGGSEGYHRERPWQEACSAQEVPPVYFYIHGSLQCSKLSQTPFKVATFWHKNVGA